MYAKCANFHGLPTSGCVLTFCFFVGLVYSFRVMDEFDVFMDAMSRNIAIKQVIAFAKKDSSRQFILITPQVTTVTVYLSHQ